MNDLIIKRIPSSHLIKSYQYLYKVNINNILEGIDEVVLYHNISTGYKYFYPFSINGDSKFYEALEKNPWYYMPWKWEHEESLKYIDFNDKVLEVGCAYGSFLSKVKEIKNADVFGLELNQRAIKKLKEINIPISQLSIEKFSDVNIAQYEVACAFQVLEHIPNPYSFIESSLKCLKKGGKLILSVPNNSSFIKYDNNPLNMPPHHMGLWNEKSLKSIATLFNLRIVTILKEPLQDYHVEWYVRVILKYFIGWSWLYKILYRIKLRVLLEKIVKRLRNRIIGHSILIVFEK